jgi:hypothetical protein
MEFTLKNKATKKVVDIQGISMEEFAGDAPVITVFFNGEKGEDGEFIRESANLPRDPSVSIEDFVSAESEDFVLTKKGAKASKASATEEESSN